MKFQTLSLAAVLFTSASPAVAEAVAEIEAAEAGLPESQTITVEGKRDEYGVRSTSTATR